MIRSGPAVGFELVVTDWRWRLDRLVNNEYVELADAVVAAVDASRSDGIARLRDALTVSGAGEVLDAELRLNARLTSDHLCCFGECGRVGQPQWRNREEVIVVSNPNVRVKTGESGERVEYIDPFADWAEMLFSKQGLAAVVGADILINGGEMLGAGAELFGDVGGAVGDLGAQI